MGQKTEKKMRRLMRKIMLVKYDEYWQLVIDMGWKERLFYCWHVMKKSKNHGRK